MQGGIVNGWNGVIAGGAGALLAETVADVFAPKAPVLASVYDLESQIGRALTQEEFYHYWNEQTEGYIRSIGHVEHAAKITATLAAVAAQHDVSTANLAAHAAIDNNFLVLAGYGITTACVAYSAKNVYDAYQDHGIEGVLHQLGIEVVTYAAGYAAGKVVFKIGGAVYPTAQAAMNVALDAIPGLKHALGSVADTLIVAGERFGQTKLGQAIASVEAALINAEQQAYRKAVAAKDAVLKQLSRNQHGNMCAAARLSKDPLVREILAKKVDDGVNPTCQAILKDGYYEVNGMKFSEYYYNRLWNNGRPAPTFIVKDILQSVDIVIPHMKTVGEHTKLPGFLQYQTANWELVYNPITKEVWHLEPLKVIKLK